MKVTALEEYGLRCLVQLAEAFRHNRSITIGEIATAEKLSVPYVGKIMATLRTGGLVTSERGRSGGYSLSRDPRAITLDEALSVVGGRLFSSRYCERYHNNGEPCVHAEQCRLRPLWGLLELLVGGMLKRLTLADLLEDETAVRSILSAALDESVEENSSRVEALSSVGDGPGLVILSPDSSGRRI